MLQSSQKIPPDFSFPRKYNTHIVTPPPRTRAPPNFGFSTIKPKETKVTATTPQTTTIPQSPRTLPPFLRLPLEIRLQIYADVLSIHPIFHAHLAPPPPPNSSTQILKHHTPISAQPLGHSLPTTFILTSTITSKHQPITTAYPTSLPTLTHHHQSLARGKIPTGLLACCKQIYAESHLIPWETNTFNFINWFWSGVYASRQFTRGLRDWQAAGMRWVGVEVLTRDLVYSTSSYSGERGGRTDWIELCRLWKGVWGVRLGVKGSLKGKGMSSGVGVQGGGEAVFTRPEDMPEMGFACGEDCRVERGLLDVEQEWVVEGLMQLQSLKWIELELEDEDVGREEKLRFCGELEGALNKGKSGKGEQDRFTRVVFVEKMSKENENFMWFGGVPGNESQ